VTSAQSAPPIAALATFLVALAAQRLGELWLSARHTSHLRARGAVEYGRGHFPLFVALHVLFPVLLVVEVFAGGARPGPSWPFWLLVLLFAQVLRYWSMHSLGELWNVRVWVLPGAPRVTRGPYRYVKHPNYLAVALELAAAPLLFGAWRTACLVSALNLLVLAIRISVEEKALTSCR
jgi:methyltransferase